MVRGNKGLAKAAAELVRSEPQHSCDAWTRSDASEPGAKPFLETQVELRARKHAVEFEADTPHFPKYYKVTPSCGIIPAGTSVTLTIRLSLTEKTRRTKYQHARGSALWTDLRVHVQRSYGEEDEPSPEAFCKRGSALWAQEKLLDADRLSEVQWRPLARGARQNRTRKLRRSRCGQVRPLSQSATFVKTLKLRPLLVDPSVECSICIEKMNVRRHAAGVEEERLFAYGCGHVFHMLCVTHMAEAILCYCGCVDSEEVSCPLCRRPLSGGEYEMLKPWINKIHYY